MSTGAFLARMGIAKLGKLGDQVTTALVQFDPETASQVQIDQMAAHCQDLAARVAKAEPEEECTHKVVQGLEDRLSKLAQTAGVIGDQIKANPNNSSDLEKKLNILMDEVDKIGGEEGDGSKSGELFDARQDHAQAEQDLHEWQTVHAGAVANLTTARKRLEGAQHDMERARNQQARAEEHQRQAEEDAGLKQGLDSQSVALSAMEKAAADAKQRARAAEINTDSIKQTSGAGSSVDDIVNETLAAPKPVSALDRLAKLNKAA